MIPKECKRLAEVDFPIAVVSKHSAREKSIRHGHPSTLHLWWARRPLAACRSMLMALLLPDPCDPNCPADFKAKARGLLNRPMSPATPGKTDADLRAALLRFIGDFADWDNAGHPVYLEIACGLVKAAHPEETPLVVDPFAGDGSIPLEALRLGCDAFASDLNPVACLICKVLLEDIPRHGPELAEELRRVGAEVKKAAERELAEFYPVDPDGARPIAYLWARTVRCEAPNCGAEIPLMRSFWLCKKADRRRALRPKIILPSPPGRGVGGEGRAGGEGGVGGEGGPKPIKVKPPLPPDLLEFARNLRKEQTDAEALMWSLLRGRRLAGRKFRRQHPVEPYVLDFYCHELQLAVELDGGQHNTPEGRQHDEKRSEFLTAKGIRVLRFWNHDVIQDTEVVLEAIWNAITDQGTLPSPPTPLPEGEGSQKPSPCGRGVGEGTPWNAIMDQGTLPSPPTPLPEGEGSQKPSPSGRGLGEGTPWNAIMDQGTLPSPPTPLPEGEGSQKPSPSGRGLGEGTPRVEFEIFTPTTEKDVRGGTVSRAKATCLCCGAVLPPERVRAQLAAQRGGADVIFEPSPPAPLPEGEGSQKPSPSGRGQLTSEVSRVVTRERGSQNPSPPGRGRGEGTPWNAMTDQGTLPSPLTPLPEGEGSQKPSPSGRGLGEGTPWNAIMDQGTLPSPLTPLPEGEGSQKPSPSGRGQGEGTPWNAITDQGTLPSPLTPLPEGEGNQKPSPSGRGQGEGIPKRIGGARLLAVVTLRDGEPGRHYRLPTDSDYQAVWKAQQRLKQIMEDWKKKPSPPAPLPEGEGSQKLSPSGSQKPSPSGSQKPSPSGSQKPSPSGRGLGEGLRPIPDEPHPPIGTLGFRV